MASETQMILNDDACASWRRPNTNDIGIAFRL